MMINVLDRFFKRPYPLPHLIYGEEGEHYCFPSFMPTKQAGKNITDTNNTCGVRFRDMR